MCGTSSPHSSRLTLPFQAKSLAVELPRFLLWTKPQEVGRFIGESDPSDNAVVISRLLSDSNVYELASGLNGFKVI